MGLDTSHDCWHGAYSAFMTWREELCRAACLPPLMLMEGFYEPGQVSDPICPVGFPTRYVSPGTRSCLPIKWEALRPSPLHILLSHSDCDGEIAWQDCGPIADELEKLIPKLPEGDAAGHIRNWRDKTATFVKGLRLASTLKEDVHFG